MADYFDDYELEDAKSQYELARALRNKGVQVDQGRMVSGHYVPGLSGTIANAVDYWKAGKDEKATRAKYESMSADKQAKIAEMLRSFPQQTGEEPNDQQYMDWAIRMQQLDPNAAKLGATMAHNALTRQSNAEAKRMALEDREAKRKLQAEQQAAARKASYEHKKEMQADRFAQQKSMARLIAALRPPSASQGKLIAIQGENGPVLVTQSKAAGATPYNAQSVKQSIAEQEGKQKKQQATISTQQVLDQAETLFRHPGREAGTGMSSFRSMIPGTEARGFKANIDTFKAQTFVPMVSALKGMGALSDAEGKKLTDAVGALDPSMPEQEFQNSLKSVTKYLYNKAKASGLDVQMPSFISDGMMPEQAQQQGMQMSPNHQQSNLPFTVENW